MQSLLLRLKFQEEHTKNKDKEWSYPNQTICWVHPEPMGMGVGGRLGTDFKARLPSQAFYSYLKDKCLG